MITIIIIIEIDSKNGLVPVIVARNDELLKIVRGKILIKGIPLTKP